MKLAYYPGCSLDSTAIEYGLSTRRACNLLEVELIELEDWNCCGATSAHSTNKLLSLALPARNLAIAQKLGLDILAPCAACYNRFRATEYAIRQDEAMKQRVQEIIEMECGTENETLSILDFLVNKVGTREIKKKVSRPLKGMKAACYYGCLLVRPERYTGFDDNEDPQTMDQIMKALGADALDWSYKTECCGAALATSRADIGQKTIYEILKNAQEAGAECIVTVCPVCHMNLDMRQQAVQKRFATEFNIPVFYITELVGYACGDSPETVGINRHFVDAVKYLASLPEKAQKMEEQKVKKTAKRAVTSAADKEALAKKINAFKVGLEKNPDKVVKRIVKDEEKAKMLVEIIKDDAKKINKLAELMVTDLEKAEKAAEAYITVEQKKRQKAGSS